MHLSFKKCHFSFRLACTICLFYALETNKQTKKQFIHNLITHARTKIYNDVYNLNMRCKS